MRILVTGHKGFIGSHVAAMLVEQRHEVWGYDSGVANVDFAPQGMTGAKHDSLEELITIPSGTEHIVHCAARADISANWHHPVERQRLWGSNIAGTIALLEAARGVPITFLSTLAVYGTNVCFEGDACIASSPYAASKLAGEALIQAYAHESGARWQVLRLAAVVGANYHHGHIADFAAMARVLGTITPRSNGRVRKSAVHVADVCQAVGMAVRGDLGNGTYNVASGSWCPRDTARLMGLEDATEWPLNDTGWVGDPAPQASGNRLRSMGWRPLHAIETGVREALESLSHGR